MIYRSTTLLSTTFRKIVNQITPTDSYTIQDIFSETFGKNASHYIQYEYKDGCLNAIFLKNPWKKKSLVDILDSLNVSKCLLLQAVDMSEKNTKSHITLNGDKVCTETSKNKASKPARVTKIKRLQRTKILMFRFKYPLSRTRIR